jgi:hypothetical protein
MRDGHPATINAGTTKRGSHASAPQGRRGFKDRVGAGERKYLLHRAPR